MGTTGGDRERLYKTVKDSNNYAVISPQMGKQVLNHLYSRPGIMSHFLFILVNFTYSILV